TQYKVILEDYYQLMLSIGTPEQHVLQNFSIDGYKDIIRISNFITPTGEHEGILDGGAYWHTDMSYKPQLGIATALMSIREPDYGGYTQFIDMVDALSILRKNSALLTKLENICGTSLETIQVHHTFGNRRAMFDPSQPTQLLTNDQQITLSLVIHNLVQVHPYTGQQSLFAVSGTAICFDGVPQEVSLPLLNELEDFIIENSQFYQHHYCSNDIIIWDNLLTLHRGYAIKPSHNIQNSRLLYRINVNYSNRGHLL
uniref:TauD/TfdA dioxygenase family protein n=1 Tax=Providencia stuartii TaxID=588 RepID=UPI002AA0AECC